MVSHKSIAAFFLCALFLFGQVGIAYANVTQIQQLRFGRWSVTQNNGLFFITVAPNGTYNSSPSNILMGVAPQPGIYQVDGLPPFHVIGSVDITVNFPMTGSGPVFNVDTFTTAYGPADGAGVAIVTVGATARTSGTFAPYPDDTYVGSLHIEINL